MARATIQKGDAKGKKFKVVFDIGDKKKTIQFGQKGSNIRPGTEKAKNFKKRHGIGKSGMTAKDYLNKATWSGKGVGDTVSIPNRVLKGKSKKTAKDRMK